jgi:catechol 2,3-dioxygenase-like lactoylglutathione lyase family enzyme
MARLDGIHHLKFPTSDLDASLDWWQRAFGAERQKHLDHITTDGRLYAYVIRVPGLDLPIELRQDPEAAAGMRGFDPVTFAAATEIDLHAWARRLEGAGLDHSPVLRGLVGWLLATRDPDGLSVRIYTREMHEWDPVNADTDSPWVTGAR